MGLLVSGIVLEHDVVRAALDDGDRGNQRQTGLQLQLRNVQSAAAAHGGLDLVQGQGHVISQRAGAGYVGVDAFLEGQLGSAAHVAALPVVDAGELNYLKDQNFWVKDVPFEVEYFSGK